MPEMTRAELAERLIRAACNAADLHLVCSYPSCACRHVPAAIEGTLAELDAMGLAIVPREREDVAKAAITWRESGDRLSASHKDKSLSGAARLALNRAYTERQLELRDCAGRAGLVRR